MMDDYLPSVYLFRVTCLFKYFAHLKNWLVCFPRIENYLYIIDTSLLSVVFRKYFLPICGLSFIFLTRLFEEQKILMLMKSNLLFFSFMGHLFFVFNKSLPNSKSVTFPHVFLLEGCSFRFSHVVFFLIKDLKDTGLEKYEAINSHRRWN